MADFLVRVVDIARNLTSRAGRVEHSNLARAQSLSYGLARDLDIALARDLADDLATVHGRGPARNRRLARARARALDLAQHLAHALREDLASDLALALDFDLALDFASALDFSLTLLRAPDPDIAHAPELDIAGVRNQASELASLLAGALSDLLGIEHLDGLADALVNGAMDDFSQADLSQADLAHIGLVGVHWSLSGTRWPPSLDVEALKQQSEEAEPGSGIYVIVRRGETERVSEEVRV